MSDTLNFVGYTRFLSLFEMGGGKLDLGLVHEVGPQLREAVSFVVDQCVANVPSHEYTGPDGTTFRIVNLDERRQVTITSAGDTLTLPRFVLEQTNLGKRWDRVEDIEAKAEALQAALRIYQRLGDEFTVGAEDLRVAHCLRDLQRFLIRYVEETGLRELLDRLEAKQLE
jgi:hypothetical protein